MTKKNNRPQDLEPRQINRKIVYTSLAVAGVFALPVVLAIVINNADMTEEEVNEPIDVVFYQTTAQCEADTKKQQDEYALLLKKYQAGQITQSPTAPPLQPQDCAPQMLAAQQEHNKTAPVYASLTECQAEGVKCEAVPANEPALPVPKQTNSAAETGGSTYRPIYGGTYIDPYDTDPSYTHVIYSGTQYRVYETRPVYQSIHAGNVVTPYGREIAQTTTGRVTAPRHTSFAAPSRPLGTSGSGTIRGRSTQGFGSSFKSTGRGGK